MKVKKVWYIIWLSVVLGAIVVLVSTHMTLAHAVSDKSQMGINGKHVSQFDPFKTDFQDFSGHLSFNNTDFEYPAVTEGTPVVEENYPGIGWQTTDFYGVIEYWNKKDVPNHSSGQFIEINATNQASVYQDIYGQFMPGQRIVYKFDHRARRLFTPIEKLTQYEAVRFVSGAPGYDYNQNELAQVVAPGSYVSGLFKTTQGNFWNTNTGSFTIPQNVSNVLRVAFVAESHKSVSKSDGNFLDNVNFSTATPPSFSSTVDIKENRTILNTASKKRIIEVSNLIERVSDESDIDWRNQSFEVILPIGATIPADATAKYNDGTIEKLVARKTSDNSFVVSGLTKNFYDSVDITYKTNFGNVLDERAVITGNFKFSASVVEGCEVFYNVWGIDYSDIKDEYKLEFNLNGAEKGRQPESKYYLAGEKTVRPNVEDFIKKGHTFTGWSVTADGSSDLWDFVSDKMPSENKILYANWEPNKYQVDYVTNSSETPLVASEEVLYMQKISMPLEPIKKGYTFIEWNTKEDLNGNAWQFGIDKMPDRAIKLYAKYKPNSYKVVFSYNDERGIYNEQNILYGSKLVAPNFPKKQGYKFSGWNTKSDGTGVFWNFESKYESESDLVLYAIWNSDQYKVSYDGSYENRRTTEKHIFGEIINQLDVVSRIEYELAGWKLNSDGSGRKWNFTKDLIPASDMLCDFAGGHVNDSAILLAKWIENGTKSDCSARHNKLLSEYTQSDRYTHNNMKKKTCYDRHI